MWVRDKTTFMLCNFVCYFCREICTGDIRNATFATLIRSRDDWNLVKIDWFACNYNRDQILQLRVSPIWYLVIFNCWKSISTPLLNTVTKFKGKNELCRHTGHTSIKQKQHTIPIFQMQTGHFVKGRTGKTVPFLHVLHNRLCLALVVHYFSDKQRM